MSMRMLRNPVFVVPVVALSFLIGVMPAVSTGATLPSQAEDSRSLYVGRIQAALAQEELAGRLADLGLSSQEISQRLDRIPTAELAVLAAQADQVNAGGNGTAILIAIGVIAFIWILIRYTDLDNWWF